MSALPPRADVNGHGAGRPLLTLSGHSRYRAFDSIFMLLCRRGDWQRLTTGASMNKLLTMTFAAALLTALAGPSYADHNEKTVFVTSAVFDGNLGGLTGADDKCQAEADGPASIVPSGTYLAWLSDGIDSPDTRFTKTSHPYMLSDGTKIAEDFTDLTDGSILHSIDIDPTGKPLSSWRSFWTGTIPDGSTALPNLTCGGWLDPSVRSWGKVGVTSHQDDLWTYHYKRACSRSYRLACFQQ